ncbi:MAG: LysR family transcriptional regulator [Pseudomonadota bacterium]
MRRVDLNLLYLLRELQREPNTTQVAKKVGISQSAVSTALGRLRWAFEDELFVRSGRSMVPTPMATRLVEPVEEIIQLVEELLEEVHLEPEKLKRTFTVATAGFVVNEIGGPLLAQLRKIAPGVSLHFPPVDTNTRGRLRTGHLDLLIGPFLNFEESGDNIRFQGVYHDRLVAIVWAKSQRYGDTLAEAELAEADQVIVRMPTDDTFMTRAQLYFASQEFRPNIIGEFSTPVSAARSVEGTDAVAVLPRQVFEYAAHAADLRALELPLDVDNFEVGLAWNARFDSDPEHQWFREIVAKTIEERIRPPTLQPDQLSPPG